MAAADVGNDGDDTVTEIYAGRGITFRYPSFWVISEEDRGDDVTVTVQSPGTSFWMITLFPHVMDPDEVLDSIVETYAEDYDDLDIYPSKISLCSQPTAARDLDFVCFDLVSSAYLRAFQTSDQTVLVLYQGDDHELDFTRPLMEGITRSLRCDTDET